MPQRAKRATPKIKKHHAQRRRAAFLAIRQRLAIVYPTLVEPDRGDWLMRIAPELAHRRLNVTVDGKATTTRLTATDVGRLFFQISHDFDRTIVPSAVFDIWGRKPFDASVPATVPRGLREAIFGTGT